MDVIPIVKMASEKSNAIENEFIIKSSAGSSGLDSILSLQNQLADLYGVLSGLLRKRLSRDDYDLVHDILNKWDSLYSYYNLDFGNVKIKKDKSLTPESLMKSECRQYIRGIVVKCAMEKTVTVLVERKVTHHPTGKKIPRSTKYLVHDAGGFCQVGDEVLAYETKPISKKKNHVFFRKILQ